MQIIRRAIASAIGVIIAGFSTSANAYPQLNYMKVYLNSNVDNCLQRSINAVRKNKYQNLEIHQNKRHSRNFIEAYKSDMTAIVDCTQISNKKSRAIIMIAGEETVNRLKIRREINNIRRLLKYGSTNSFSQPQTMSEAKFAQFMTAFKRELAKPFDSKPLGFLAQPSRTNYFTAQQVREIVTQLAGPFSSDHKVQLEAAVMLYPRVIDKSNWYLVDGTVTSRSQLRVRIEKLKAEEDSIVNTFEESLSEPISEEKFAQFMTAFKRELAKPFDSKPLGFLAQPSKTNYFTAQQVGEIVTQLAGPFSSDHKVQLKAAVMLYPRVIDKSNWYLVDGIVTLRNQLRARIEKLTIQKNP